MRGGRIAVVQRSEKSWRQDAEKRMACFVRCVLRNSMTPSRILLSLVATLAVVSIAIQLSITADSEDSRPDPAPSPREAPLSPPIPHEMNVSAVIYDAAPPIIQHDCTNDCSGFEVGYRWAAERNIEDAEACTGLSESISEGCWIYAKEREEMQKVAAISSLGAETSISSQAPASFET